MTHGLFTMIAYALTTVWVAGVWQGALFVVLGAVSGKLLPSASATVRHSLLVGLFGLSIVLPWLPLHHANGATYVTHAVPLSLWAAVAITVCWAVAALVRLAGLTIAWQHLHEVRHNAVPFELDLKKMDIGVSRLPLVCTSTEVDSPLIVGFFSPVLLLPVWLVPKLSAEELYQIALHECEHLRRNDDWINLFLQICLTLFPLNPALLWLNGRIGVQRELACDAAVVAATSRPVAYAASLARIADQHLRRNTLRFALAAWGRQSELSQRIHALLKQRRGWSAMQRAAAAGGLTTILLALMVGLTRAPQFICVPTPATLAMASTTGYGVSSAITPVVSRNSGAEPFKLAAAAYVAHPAARVTRGGTHKVFQPQRPSEPEFVETSLLVPVETAPIRLTRASTTTTGHSSGGAEQPEPSVRAVPALFSTTYLAVPVSNGWLLIQL